MIGVSFQGERGAYSEAAARAFFRDESIKTVPHNTFARALQSTVDGHTEYTILPVENSIEGSVGESHDLLRSTPLFACGEIRYKIRHCLIGYGKLDDVGEVWSHPQALGQCRRFIEDFGIKAVPVYDTAGSIKSVRDARNPRLAGIASREAAIIYDVPVIVEDIADNANNYTRFLLLSKTRANSTENAKTSIIFSVAHEPGSLYKILEHFYKNNVNLTMIESRPTRSNAWEYNFYLDFEGHMDDPKVSDIIERIGKTAFIRVLGSYESAGP